MKTRSELLSRKPKSKFIKVRCTKCKNEQILFGKSATIARCLVCNNILGEPTGGKTKIKAKIIGIFE